MFDRYRRRPTPPYFPKTLKMIRIPNLNDEEPVPEEVRARFGPRCCPGMK
jgi:hypothetical protein